MSPAPPTLAGALQPTVLSASYAPRTYTILNATGGVTGTFTGLPNNAGLTLTGIGASLRNPHIVYDADNAYIVSDGAVRNALNNLLPPSATGNQHGVSNAINNAVNSGFTPPGSFDALLNLSGPNLTNALNQISGPAVTGGTQGATQLTNSFLSLLLNPFGISGGGGGGGAIGYARGFGASADLPPEVAAAYAAVTPLDVAGSPDRRWGVWSQVYGGANKTNGDAITGTADTSSRTYGLATGADYRVTPDVLVGFALAGGSTSWALSGGLGSGRSDVFQAGVYGIRQFGAAYVSAAASYAWHQMSTDRYVTVAGTDHLTADFAAHSFGGRIEGGYRFATPIVGITPYAAVQAQTFWTPDYSESAVAGSNAFALSYASRSTTTTRTELGDWFDKALALDHGDVLALRARVAWAHDHSNNPGTSALFQSLPGSNFTVNGTNPAPNLALLSAGAELRLAARVFARRAVRQRIRQRHANLRGHRNGAVCLVRLNERWS